MMNEWESRFAKRMSQLRESCGSQFEEMFTAEVLPAFETMASFVATGGITAAIADGCHEVRSFSFTLSEDCGLHVVFTLKGPYEVEASYSINSIHGTDDRVPLERVSLSGMTEGWARKQFEIALDEFIDQAEKMISADQQQTLPPAGAQEAAA